MNQIIKTISKSLISICMVWAITSCNPINEFKTTPEPLIDSEENTITLTELENQEQMSSTQILVATSNAQTETPASSMSEAGEEAAVEEQTCIGNFSEFAYSGAMYVNSPIQQPVLPLAPWEEVVEFPRNSDNKETYYLASALQYNGEVEIWIDNYVTHKTIIFNPETLEQQVISSESVDYPGLKFAPAFILSDGTVWGRSLIFGDFGQVLYDSFPPLSRYNEETQQFEIPEGMFRISLHEVGSDYPELPLIFLDKNDIFWVFAQHDGLYQYNTQTRETKKVLKTPELEFRNGVMDQQGDIYFNRPTIGHYPIEGLKNGEILYFNPALGKLEPLSTPDQDWPAVLWLFVDPQERLWTDISGYRDIDGKWILLHENIDKYFHYFNMHQSWHVPSIEIQTLDGRFWVQREYSYYNQGTAWFDPETGEGCWFTSYNSRIIEDANNRLWFEADGKLYKYDLLP